MGSLSGGLYLWGSLSGAVREAPADKDLSTVTNGRYTSYWNAFLFVLISSLGIVSFRHIKLSKND